MAKNASASLLARLKNQSKATGIPMPMMMRKYAHDRLLSLMCETGTAEHFCLKGGVLLGTIFEGNVYRPTNDLDFNGMTQGMSIQHLEDIIVKTCESHDGSDGLTFDLSTMKVMKDRDGIIPGGKLAFDAMIGMSRIGLRIDVGYGNVITPDSRPITINTALPDLVPPIQFAAYPLETVISEKIHAMCRHGAANTRIKDYFDIYIMSRTFEFSGDALSAAIRNTFAQHEDEIPVEFLALSDRFAQDRVHQKQWQAFLKETMSEFTDDFPAVIDSLRSFIEPAARMAIGNDVSESWHPDAGWITYSIQNNMR